MPPVISVSKGCCSHQTLQSSSNGVLWRNSGWKITGHWSQIAEVHIKEIISVSPDSCIFPYTEKHQIPWDTWFSLMNSNLLRVWLPDFCYKNSYISWLLWPLSLRSSLLSFLRCYILSSVHQIKHNSQLSGVNFFFFLINSLNLQTLNNSHRNYYFVSVG